MRLNMARHRLESRRPESVGSIRAIRMRLRSSTICHPSIRALRSAAALETGPAEGTGDTAIVAFDMDETPFTPRLGAAIRSVEYKGSGEAPIQNSRTGAEFAERHCTHCMCSRNSVRLPV